MIVDLRFREFHQWQLSPGEAQCDILQHRWGLTRTIDVAFQGHYARFLEMTFPEDDYRILRPPLADECPNGVLV